ncbi:MAG: hypothetical protein K0U16_05670, partial [Gammaproteobacteria bacterium]|nr:hypothetical protein [Gammaproteobacteria bacterium]
MLQIENKTQQFYRYSKLIQLQEIEHSIKQRISSRIKRAPSVNTLVEATAKNDFSYWLSQEDIADIARIEYNQFRTRTENNAEFEILGSMTQLSSTVKSFQEKIKTNKWSKALLTLIMNLENLHWVTMLISYKNNNYVAYYVDSKNNPIPQNYFELLYNPYLIHPIINLNSGYMQQKDGFNCGLWALENAVVLNAMFDHKEPLDWLSKALRRVHDKNYFEGKRILLSEKLINDPLWKERHLNFVHPDEISKKTQLLDDSFTLDKLEHDSKRLKASPNKEKEKVTALLEIFVTTFLSFFLKNIGIYHVLAKEKRLTAEALKVEIKTGATSALFGVYIADSLVGLIPGLVASLRAISGKYYISKDKAQKITHFFSNVESGNLDSMLAEVAVNIFYSFESQFMQVTDKAGEKVAIEKLAEDAVERIFNAINKFYDVNSVFSKQLLEEGMLKGASEKFFDPNIKEIALTTSGYMILNKEGKKINTSKLYEHTGLVELGANNQPNKFYATKKYSRHRYGYRRLFDWEKEANGELKKNLKEQYVNDQFLQAHDIFQFHLRKYSYVLSQETNQAEASRLLDKIKSYQFSKPVIKEQTNK